MLAESFPVIPCVGTCNVHCTLEWREKTVRRCISPTWCSAKSSSYDDL